MPSTFMNSLMASSRLKRLIVAPLAMALLLAIAMTATASARPLVANIDTNVGGCPVRGSALYETTTNALTLDYYTRSPYLFAACRVKLVTGFRIGEHTVGTLPYDVPTACALTDPSCASTVQGTARFNGAFQPAFLIQYLDNITLSADGR